MDVSKHCDTKLGGELYLSVKTTIADLRTLWSSVADDKRMEIVKSVIWTAPDMNRICAKIHSLTDPKNSAFQTTLD